MTLNLKLFGRKVKKLFRILNLMNQNFPGKGISRNVLIRVVVKIINFELLKSFSDKPISKFMTESWLV